MPERRRYFDDNELIVNFETSPQLSTYLIAYIIGEFDQISEMNNGTLFRIFTKLGDSEKGKFALQIAQNCTEFFNQFFQTKYILPKMDLVAIPE